MSSRPRRSCIQPTPPPSLPELLKEIEDATEEEVRLAFQKVSAFYKEDVEHIAAYWLCDTALFQLQVPQHIQLVALIMEKIPLRDDRALTYLNTLTSDYIERIRLVRAMRSGKFYYRIRTGDRTHW